MSLDIYPFKKAAFRISVGALFNQNRLTGSPDPNQNITINGITFTPAEVGNLRLRIEQDPVNPYIAVGGNILCFGSKRWAFGYEVGVAYGEWDVSLTRSGGIGAPGLDQAIARERRRIENDFNDFPIWPIVKLNVSFSF